LTEDDNMAGGFGFEDLDVYKAARNFRCRIYKLVQLLPKEEAYALGQQMRRAAISLTNNITEGYGRHNWQDNTQFCRIARGSLMELVDDINICLDANYAKPEHLSDLKSNSLDVLRLLNGYIAYLQKRKSSKKQA